VLRYALLKEKVKNPLDVNNFPREREREGKSATPSGRLKKVD